MEEFRRFLRYVIPGLVFIIELLFYFFLLEWLFDLKLLSETMKSLKQDVAYAVLLFIVAGGGGFLLGIFYHSLRFCSPKVFQFNFVPLVEDALNRDWLRLPNGPNVAEFDAISLDINNAWQIVTSFWYERQLSSIRIKGVETRTRSIVDVIHGLGATLVGSCITLIICIFIFFVKFSELRFPDMACDYYYYFVAGLLICFFFFFPVIILFVNWYNFQKAKKDLEGIVNIITLNHLEVEFQKNNTPTTINIPRKRNVL